MQKQMANAIPTCARALDRLAEVVTSERMALNRNAVHREQRRSFGSHSKSLHGNLNVAFAQTSNHAGKNVGRECGRLHPPASCVRLEPEALLSKFTYTSADTMFPIIVQSRTRFLPYLSDRAPMRGETKNCSVLGSPVQSRLPCQCLLGNSREYRAHEATCIC